MTGLTKRLNPGFRAKAPPQVIEEFETKLEAAKERLARLSAARALLG